MKTYSRLTLAFLLLILLFPNLAFSQQEILREAFEINKLTQEGLALRFKGSYDEAIKTFEVATRKAHDLFPQMKQKMPE